MSDTHAESVAFVRETAIPPSAPPSTATGPVKWVRDNLFPTWMNALLTIAAIYFIWLILSSTLPWVLGGIWNTNSLAACREILDGRSAACF